MKFLKAIIASGWTCCATNFLFMTTRPWKRQRSSQPSTRFYWASKPDKVCRTDRQGSAQRSGTREDGSIGKSVFCPIPQFQFARRRPKSKRSVLVAPNAGGQTLPSAVSFPVKTFFLLTGNGRFLFDVSKGKWGFISEIRRPASPHACSSGRQPLQTSTHSTKLEEYFSSSSQVISMALLLLPAAGNTVSNRFRETSR